MDFSTLIQEFLITETGGILFLVALILGYAFKIITELLGEQWKKANQLIPVINAVLCGALSVVVPDLSVGYSAFLAFVNGALVAISASFAYDKLREKLQKLTPQRLQR